VLVVLFDLAPDVQQERAVGRVDDLGARDRVDGGDDLRPVVRAGCVDDQVVTWPRMPCASLRRTRIVSRY